MATGTESREPGGILGGASGVNATGFAWLLFAIVSALPIFWFGIEGLLAEWSTPEYSHGPIIPLLSFYMFLRETRLLPPAERPVTDRWVGILVIALALGLALLGNLVQIADIVFYAMIVWVAGLLFATYGFRRGLFFWPSVVHLVFMLPLPQFIYWKLNIQLQFISSEIGVWLVRLAGVPVFLDGNVIDLGVYKLLVAEACSGLRYLFPIMSFSYVFAVLYRGPLWHKIVLLLAAAPLAVLMNSFRIGVIGVMVDRFGIGHAEGFLHFFEGWVIFISCIAILFLMAVAMRWFSGERGRLGEAIDMDFSGLGGQLRKVLSLRPYPALIGAALVTAALSAAFVFAPARAAVDIEREPFSLFPRQIGAWSGTASTLEPDIERVLGADDYLAAFYNHPEHAEGVDFFVAYYHSQTEGEGIHSPEACLPAGGWEIYALERTMLPMTETSFGTFPVNRAVIQRNLDQQLVYYWFEGRGRRITNDFVAKFQTVADSARFGRSDGALVRVITPIGPGGIEAAEERLQGFLAATLDRLPRHVPE